MTVGVMLVAMWFVAVVAYLLWQFGTNALGAQAVPLGDTRERVAMPWTPGADDAAGGVSAAPVRVLARAS